MVFNTVPVESNICRVTVLANIAAVTVPVSAEVITVPDLFGKVNVRLALNAAELIVAL
jgi:hypothetical protein